MKSTLKPMAEVLLPVCRDCRTARVSLGHAGYQAGCTGCQVRAMAKSKVFADWQQTGHEELTGAYRTTLARVFDGRVDIAHASVRAEAARLKGIA